MTSNTCGSQVSAAFQSRPAWSETKMLCVSSKLKQRRCGSTGSLMPLASALSCATIPSLGHTAGLPGPGSVNFLPAIRVTGILSSTPDWNWFHPLLPIRNALLTSRPEPDISCRVRTLKSFIAVSQNLSPPHSVSGIRSLA